MKKNKEDQNKRIEKLLKLKPENLAGKVIKVEEECAMFDERHELDKQTIKTLEKENEELKEEIEKLNRQIFYTGKPIKQLLVIYYKLDCDHCQYKNPDSHKCEEEICCSPEDESCLFTKTTEVVNCFTFSTFYACDYYGNYCSPKEMCLEVITDNYEKKVYENLEKVMLGDIIIYQEETE